MYQVLGVKKGIDRCYVLGDNGDVCALTEEGVRLFDRFTRIAGVGDDISISVYEAIDMGDTRQFWNVVPVLMIGDARFLSLEGIHERQEKGHQIYGKFEGSAGDEFMNFNPSIALSHGVHALVDDTGCLLYLNPLNKESVVLGDFCMSMGEYCIQFFHNRTVYIFDDRINYVPNRLCSLPSKSMPLKINTSGVHDLVLKSALEWQKTQGYAVEVSL